MKPNEMYYDIVPIYMFPIIGAKSQGIENKKKKKINCIPLKKIPSS